MMDYYSVLNERISIEFEVHSPLWSKIFDQSLKISDEVFKTLNLYSYANKIEFSVILTNDEEIRKINKEYRHKDCSTNTLSFPVQDIMAEQFENLEIDDGFLLLGDVIFAYETILKESNSSNISFEEHFYHLLVHGLLHLLGFDHQEDEEATKMESLEVAILSKFSIKSPY